MPLACTLKLQFPSATNPGPDNFLKETVEVNLLLKLLKGRRGYDRIKWVKSNCMVWGCHI